MGVYDENRNSNLVSLKNYGTILQAYALQKFLKNNGYDCVLINYIPIYRKNFLQKIISGNLKHRVESKIESYKLKLLKSNVKELILLRNKAFESFITRNIDFTKRVQTTIELSELNETIDCFICGSDQIWNPENFNEVYYLDFVNEKNKRISYAPSFGVNQIPPSKIEKIQKLVNKFN